jgi:hypothetical protein
MIAAPFVTHPTSPSKRIATLPASDRGAETPAAIMEIFKLCVVQGVQACNLGVPILAEEIAART